MTHETTLAPKITAVPVLDQQTDFTGDHTEQVADIRKNLLQEALREQLTVLVSDEPGIWSKRFGQAQGEIAFETTFGGSGIVIERGNNGVDPLFNLLNSGETPPVYFNEAKEEDLIDSRVRAKRTVFEESLNDPVIVIQGKLPESLIAPGVVLGPSPFIRRMLSYSDVATDFGPRVPAPVFSLKHVERLALLAPDKILDDTTTPGYREKEWAHRYLALIEQLARSGIKAEPDSPGSKFQDQLREKLQQV